MYIRNCLRIYRFRLGSNLLKLVRFRRWVRLIVMKSTEVQDELEVDKTTLSNEPRPLLLAFLYLWYILTTFFAYTRPFFSCDAVGIESIWYRTRANRPINESNTTGGLRKIWTGTRSSFFLSSSEYGWMQQKSKRMQTIYWKAWKKTEIGKK